MSTYQITLDSEVMLSTDDEQTALDRYNEIHSWFNNPQASTPDAVVELKKNGITVASNSRLVDCKAIRRMITGSSTRTKRPNRRTSRLPIDPDFGRFRRLEHLVWAKSFRTLSPEHQKAILRDYFSIYRRLYYVG